MFGQREFKSYEKFEGVRPEPRILHQTFTPQSESHDHVSFKVKSSGKNAHMSSTMYIERKFRLQPELPSLMPESSVLAANADHTRQYRPIDLDISKNTLKYVRSPGFVLQNNASNMIFNCNAGSVASDPKFLESYARLYEKPLKQFIRGSGKSFSNHNDAVIRTAEMNVQK